MHNWLQSSEEEGKRSTYTVWKKFYKNPILHWTIDFGTKWKVNFQYFLRSKIENISHSTDPRLPRSQKKRIFWFFLSLKLAKKITTTASGIIELGKWFFLLKIHKSMNVFDLSPAFTVSHCLYIVNTYTHTYLLALLLHHHLQMLFWKQTLQACELSSLSS